MDWEVHTIRRERRFLHAKCTDRLMSSRLSKKINKYTLHRRPVASVALVTSYVRTVPTKSALLQGIPIPDVGRRLAEKAEFLEKVW